MSDRPQLRSPRTVVHRTVDALLRVTPLLLLLPAGLLAWQAPPETSIEGQCEELEGPSAESGRASVWGFVREAGGDFPLPGSQVSLAWQHPHGVADTARGRLQATADADGHYRFCDVPGASTLTLRATALGQSGTSSRLAVSRGEQRRVDLRVGLASRGTGSVAGVLLDAETRKPLDGAAVAVRRLGIETASDRAGHFRIRDAPAGSYEMVVHHIGHGTQVFTFEVLANNTHHVEIHLSPVPIPLQPITVTLETRPRWLENAGFYDRRAKGLGQFRGPEWVERRRPNRFSQVLEDMPGLRIRPRCTPHCSYFVQTTTTAGLCPPTFYIDGKRLRLGSIVDLDALVSAHDVAAVEVYRGISQTPAQYFGKCGSVVIWTKRGAG